MDASGNALWTANGIPVCAVGDDHNWLQIISDGSGGAVIAWEDYRNSDWDIYAQRIDADGNALWTANGLPVSTATDEQFEPQLVSDGSGGAIITWMDWRNPQLDIYAQRMGADGTALWTADGVVVCDATHNQGEPAIVSDGSGGAIIVWEHWREDTYMNLYAQRIDSNGNGLWTANGVAVSPTTDTQDDPKIASDGSGGAIIAWEDERNGDEDIYAQRLDGDGDLLWGTDGIPISTEDYAQEDPVIIGDGVGGAFIVWESDDDEGVTDLYAQRIRSSGDVSWTVNGIAVSIGDYDYDEVAMALANTGMAVVSWTDNRGTNLDIYAQKIGMVQEMDLKQDATDLADGDTHDFGTRDIGTDTDVVFIIENTGTKDLTLTVPLEITGTDADQFSIVEQPESSIASDATDTFTVRFSPTSTGNKTAAISIANNDEDENPYDLVLEGTGQSAAAGGGGGGGGGGAPTIDGDGDVITSGAYRNTGTASNVQVGADATVNNNGTFTNVSNEGTISGGEISGNSTNSGTLSRVTVTRGSTVNNLGGTMSYGTNNGEIYGGSFEGGIENNGLIFGGAPEGYKGDGDFTVTIEAGAVIKGGTVGGDIVCNGELSDVTLLADSVIIFYGSGGLTGTITIAGETGAGTITIPDGVSFPPAGSGIVALTPQTLVAFAMANGWFSPGSFSAQQNLPALEDDLLVIAGMVLTQEEIKLSENMTVTLAYDPDAVPQGFTLEDLELLVYDPEAGLWMSADFEEVETGVIQFFTQTASAYALVLPTAGTASPILDLQSFLNPTDNLIMLTGADLADVTAAPTLRVSDDRLEEEAFLFMGMSFESGEFWLYENTPEDFENPEPAWRVYETGTAILPFAKRTLDTPRLTFDAGLADLDLTGRAFSVVIYVGIAQDENMTGFSGAAYALTFE